MGDHPKGTHDGEDARPTRPTTDPPRLRGRRVVSDETRHIMRMDDQLRMNQQRIFPRFQLQRTRPSPPPTTANDVIGKHREDRRRYRHDGSPESRSPRQLNQKDPGPRLLG